MNVKHRRQRGATSGLQNAVNQVRIRVAYEWIRTCLKQHHVERQPRLGSYKQHEKELAKHYSSIPAHGTRYTACEWLLPLTSRGRSGACGAGRALLERGGHDLLREVKVFPQVLDALSRQVPVEVLPVSGDNRKPFVQVYTT